MEETVTLSLSKYDELKKTELQKQLLAKSLNALHNRFNNVRDFLFEQCYTTYGFSKGLEQVTDINGVWFALNEKEKLLALNFSEQEMIDFITEKYNEWSKENNG